MRLFLLIAAFASAANAQSPSASFTRWRTHVQTDTMTDEVKCEVRLTASTPAHGAPFVVFPQSGDPFLFLLGDNYPGRTISVRVDSRPMIESEGSEFLRGKRLQQLLHDAAQGQRVRTRFIEWPSGAPHDEEFGLEGFGEQVAACQRAVAAARSK